MKYKSIIIVLMLGMIFGCNSTGLTYGKDGKLYLQGTPYTGPVTVFYPNGKNWTEVSYINGRPKSIVEWDESGNIKSKQTSIPNSLANSIKWQWEHHRRHLPVKAEYDSGT